MYFISHCSYSPFQIAEQTQQIKSTYASSHLFHLYQTGATGAETILNLSTLLKLTLTGFAHNETHPSPL